MNIKFGWKKDPLSDKDLSFNDAKPALAKLAASNVIDEHLIPEYTSVFNQYQLGSCVANATVGAVEILMGIQDKNSVTDLSRLFVYWNARMYSHDTDKDEGTFIRNAFDSIHTLGVCKEDAWKYDEGNVFAQPPQEAYKEGNDNQIESYYRISSDNYQRLDDVETAIRANHPVVFGTGVSKQFTEYSSSDQIWTPPTNTVGQHAMIITGVRTKSDGKRDFYVRNSWGSNWGTVGHTWFDQSYITWGFTEDLWVPTLIPNLIF